MRQNGIQLELRLLSRRNGQVFMAQDSVCKVIGDVGCEFDFYSTTRNVVYEKVL